MGKKKEEIDWEALELAIKIDNAHHLMEEAQARGDKGEAKRMRGAVRELENEAKKLGK